MKYDRFAEDIREKFIFADDSQDPVEPDDNICPKRLYLKSPWKPEPQSEDLENKIDNFVFNLEHLNKKHNLISKISTNLTNTQKDHINVLRQNENFIILMCDKNLGPEIIEQSSYVQNALNERLLIPTFILN